MRERILQAGGGIIHEGFGEKQGQNSEGWESVPMEKQIKGRERYEEGCKKGSQVGVVRREV